MRLQRPQPATDRPPAAYDLLTPEHRLDEGIEFDPQRDLTEEDWEVMKGALDEYRQAKDWYPFTVIAKNLLILFPERRHDLNLDDEVSEGINELLDDYHKKIILSQFDEGVFCSMAGSYAMLVPDRLDELHLHDEMWGGIKEGLDQYRKNQDWKPFGYRATNMAMAFPDRRHELNLDDEVWQRMKGELDKFRQLKEWGKFRPMATNLSLLFPDRRHELNLDDEVWEGMLAQLGKLRQKKTLSRASYDEFIVMSMNLTILAAQDARIAPDGRIEITPKQRKLVGEPPPLPARPR